MTSIDQLPSIAETLQEHGIQAKKSFGQNFLFDLNITDKIVSKLSHISDRHIVEIGPGPGALTRSILKAQPHSLSVIEKDDRFIPIIHSLKDCTDVPLNVHFDDALEFDYTTLDTPITVIANLPYNIATPLLINWLHMADNIQDMALMFQKEVGDRITAKPGSKTYGRLSIISQFTCITDILFDLPPTVFTPPPKVNSSVVYLRPRKDIKDRLPLIPFIEKVSEHAFGQRRKMIRQSLKQFDFNFEKLGIKETLRAEKLSIDDFVILAKELASRT